VIIVTIKKGGHPDRVIRDDFDESDVGVFFAETEPSSSSIADLRAARMCLRLRRFRDG
jgi:hypothetical protein